MPEKNTRSAGAAGRKKPRNHNKSSLNELYGKSYKCIYESEQKGGNKRAQKVVKTTGMSERVLKRKWRWSQRNKRIDLSKPIRLEQLRKEWIDKRSKMRYSRKHKAYKK